MLNEIKDHGITIGLFVFSACDMRCDAGVTQAL